MATPNEIYKVALENREALNQIKDKARETGDFQDAGVLQNTDELRVVRGGQSYKTTYAAIKDGNGQGDPNVQSDWNTTDDLDDSYIKNKPQNLSDFNNDLPAVDVTADAYSPLDTGIITGGEVTINAGDNTKVDIAAGTGIIMDWTDPANPVRHQVTWNAFTAEAMPDISEPFTNLYIGTTGNLIKVSGVLSTPEIRRQRIQLQSAEHANGLFVTNITKSSRPAYQVVDALLDYVRFNGALTRGNIYGAAAADLTIQKFFGQTCEPFINRVNNAQSPTILDNPAVSPKTFQYIYRDGAGGFTLGAQTTLITPNVYDTDTGTPTPMPNNDWSIQRMYYIGTVGVTFVTLGQATYDSKEAAQAAIFEENPVLSSLIEVASFTTALVVQDGTTDLSNLANAEFFDISVPGVTGSGSGGGTGDMLKANYDTINSGNAVDEARSLNGFDETDFVLEAEKNFSLERNWSKYPGNTNLQLAEVNDMLVDYWWATNRFIKAARYNGGDVTLLASYTIIDEIEF